MVPLPPPHSPRWFPRPFPRHLEFPYKYTTNPPPPLVIPFSRHSFPALHRRNPKTPPMSRKATDDPIGDPKKRRRVGFAAVDVGVEANDCIKIFLVSSREEVGVEESCSIDPIDLNHFFDNEGRIFGYQELKINIFLSSISFHTYADISFQSTSDGGKGITELKPSLQKIFGELLTEKKDEFLQTFTSDSLYIKNLVLNGEVLHSKATKGQSDQLEAGAFIEEVLCMPIKCIPAGELYSRLVPLVLLLVDGSSPIDITDHGWDIYLVVQKITDQEGDTNYKLLGFATLYRFYHYPDSIRLRLSQMLVLPPYQGHGHGRHLLEVINSVALSENIYDVTVEEPSDYLQHVRTCIDINRLLDFDPIKPAIRSVATHLKHKNLSKKTCDFQSNPPSKAIEDVRKALKITKKQLLHCWEILIYLELDQNDSHCIDNYRTFISDRTKAEILGKDSGAAGKQVIEPNEGQHEMAFVMFRPSGAVEATSVSHEIEGNQTNVEEQISQLVDERMKEITEVAQKVSLHRH